MTSQARRSFGSDVSRILFVKNLPFKVTGEDLYKIFGRFGSIRQARLGNGPKNKGTAFIVFDDVQHAKAAVESLTGFNVDGRYLVVLYFKAKVPQAAHDLDKTRQEVEALKKQYKTLEG